MRSLSDGKWQRTQVVLWALWVLIATLAAVHVMRAGARGTPTRSGLPLDLDTGYDGTHQGGNRNYEGATGRQHRVRWKGTDARESHVDQSAGSFSHPLKLRSEPGSLDDVYAADDVHAHHGLGVVGGWPVEVPPAHVAAHLKRQQAGGLLGDGDRSAHQSLRALSLHNVRLSPNTPESEAQKTNLHYLLHVLDPDKLLHSFRKAAGMPPKAAAYCGRGTQASWHTSPGSCWEAPDCELRGHFTGHYLSALAMAHASAGDAAAKERALYVVDELAAVQQFTKSGYLSAFPVNVLTRLSELGGTWAPLYTLHKIGAGLLDAHLLLGSAEALQVVTRMADWILRWGQRVIRVHGSNYWFLKVMEYNVTAFGAESGGMNELGYNLYDVTGDKRYLELAGMYEHPEFQQAMRLGWDVLEARHANFHVPLMVGTARRGEMFQEPHSCQVPVNFFRLVNETRMYSTGGTSAAERWWKPRQLGHSLSTENQETCTSYNMLKLARHLYTWTGDGELADYIERNHVNAVMGTQRGPGEFLYTTPLGRGVSKAQSGHGWGNPTAAFWCCYGSAVESFSRLGADIYFVGLPKASNSSGSVSSPQSTQSKSSRSADVADAAAGGLPVNARPALYINQLISSEASWPEMGIHVQLSASYSLSESPCSASLTAVLSWTSPQPQLALEVALRLRVPGWARKAAAASGREVTHMLVNGEEYPCHEENQLTTTVATKYCEVVCRRDAGGAVRVELTLPIGVHAEKLNDLTGPYNKLHALMLGPAVLAGVGEGAFVRALRAPALHLASAVPGVVPASSLAHRLVSLRLTAPAYQNRYLAATSAFSSDSKLAVYAVEPRLHTITGLPGGTGFHYTPPPTGHCQDSRNASAGACAHLFLDALSATFNLLTDSSVPEGGGDGGLVGSHEVFTLEPVTAPGAVLSHSSDSGEREHGEGGVMAWRTAAPGEKVTLRWRRADVPVQRGADTIHWPQGVWPAGGVVLEVVDRPGYILSVWSRHEQGACEDDPRASGERCRKYATRGMCRQQEDPETSQKVLGLCPRTCGQCEAERMTLRVVDPSIVLARTCQTNHSGSTRTPPRRSMRQVGQLNHQVQVGQVHKVQNGADLGSDGVLQCVFDRDDAVRFAAKSSFQLNQDFLSAYPPGSFLAPTEETESSMSHILMFPLNTLTDEVYTVHYELGV